MESINLDRCSSIDDLTKLYSRLYSFEYINKLIEKEREFSIFYIDLDNFKIVNDVYGHHIGDLVLKEIGRRLKSLENEELLFARLGGDEFIAIYQNIDKNKINDLGQIIDKISREHIVISESAFDISASIGVARFPCDSDNIDDLLKLSDMAMYRAKRSGSSNRNLICSKTNNKLASRKKMEKLLKDIDVQEDLFLEYQPIFDIKTGKLNYLEALVRWNHKTEGIIYPNDFITISEEIDLIKDITKWVFLESLEQISIWNHKYGTDYKVSLNVADACIHNKIFFDNVKYMLEIFQANPEWLIIELTECSLSSSPLYMKKLLSSINDMGIDIHIDNFGRDPIVISDLLDFKIKEIKIDKKFIDKLDSNDDICIVKAMIQLAKGLGIKTIAKGVEEEIQYSVLETLDCDKIQGFYLEKPMSKEAFEEKYLRNFNKVFTDII